MICEMDMNDEQAAEAVWYLQHAAFREEARRVGLPHVPPPTDTVESLRRSEERYIGYLSDGEWTGAVSYILNGKLLSIRRLMVHPDHFRQGIGSALIAHLLASVPHEQAEVYASERNEPAMRLYRKYGFVPVEQVPAAYGLSLLRLVRNNPALP